MNLQSHAATQLKLRPHDNEAVKFSKHLLENLQPMIKVVDKLDISATKIGGDNKGKLKSVAISLPTYLDWAEGISAAEIENIANKPDRLKAINQHLDLMNALASEGVEVILIKPSPELLEGVYTRDLGFVVADKFIHANFVSSVRQPEENTVVGGIKPPSEVKIEGGNVHIDGEFIFLGIGDRTNMEAAVWLQETVGTDFEVVPMALKHGILHSDCAFNPVARPNGTPGGAFAYLPAFQHAKDVDFMKKVYGRIFPLNEAEYKKLAANTLPLSAKSQIANPDCAEVHQKLEDLHQRVVSVALSEAIKGEGSVRCCTLPLSWQ